MATGRITLTLFDFANPVDEDGTPDILRAACEYDPVLDLKGQGPLKVSIGVGDDVSSAVVTVPVLYLSQLMDAAMSEHARKYPPSGLQVTPPKLVGFD